MARTHAASVESSGSKILVVDDQPEILKSNQAFLKNASHQVLTAGGGAVCYRMLAGTESPRLPALSVRSASSASQ